MTPVFLIHDSAPAIVVICLIRYVFAGGTTLVPSWILVVTLISGDPFWEPITDDAQLANAIGAIETLRNGKDTDFDRLELVTKELLTQISEADRRGIFLFHVVNVYAQSGMQRRDVLLNHAQDALDLLVDPPRRAALHTFCGDATRLGVNEDSRDQLRKTAASWYLRGLKEVITMDLPLDPPRNELMFFFDLADKAEERKREEEQAKRFRDSRLQRIMIFHRNVLKSQLVVLYKQQPEWRGEFEQLCSEILGDGEICRSILEAIPQAAIKSDERVQPSRYGLWIVLINIVVFAAGLVVVAHRRYWKHREIAPSKGNLSGTNRNSPN